MGFLESAIPVHLPTFETEELQRGDRLGQGEFGVVHQISKIVLKRQNKLDIDRMNLEQLEKVVEKEGEEEEEEMNKDMEIQAGIGFHDSFNSLARGSSTDSLASIEGKLIADANKFAHYDDDDDDDDDNLFYKEDCIPESDYYRRSTNYDENEVRSQMQRKCLRQGKARYAIKTLRQGTVLKYRREKKVLDALAIEAKFLSVVEHPNIIKMRGVASLDPMSSEYFIVLDRLYETLDNKLRCAWKVSHEECKPTLFKRRDAGLKIKYTCLWIERLVCAIDLSSALKYLHEHNIVYRDLKPENIGFDVREDVKLFDFGLAKELSSDDECGKNLYKFDGVIGSRRYMAPEMVLRKPYNKSLDVYSFGILLWEICSLEEPFDGYSVEKHKKFVAEKGQRPKIPNKWPWVRGLKDLMESCWSVNLSDRPSMGQIYNRLKNYVDDLEGHKGNILDRSVHMMNLSDKTMDE